MVVLMAARASRLENQDAIDCAIVSMLADPKEVQVQIYLIISARLKPFCRCIFQNFINLQITDNKFSIF